MRRIPQLGKTLDQLLCTVDIVESAREPRVLVVKTMYIAARIEDDKRIVYVSCKARCLSQLGDMTELLHESDKAGAHALDRFDLVQNDLKGVRRACSQQPRQRIAALRRVVCRRECPVENANDVLCAGKQLVDRVFVLAHALEPIVPRMG